MYFLQCNTYIELITESLIITLEGLFKIITRHRKLYNNTDLYDMIIIEKSFVVYVFNNFVKVGSSLV